jgi:hypothetical protein
MNCSRVYWEKFLIDLIEFFKTNNQPGNSQNQAQPALEEFAFMTLFFLPGSQNICA